VGSNPKHIPLYTRIFDQAQSSKCQKQEKRLKVVLPLWGAVQPKSHRRQKGGPEVLNRAREKETEAKAHSSSWR